MRSESIGEQIAGANWEGNIDFLEQAKKEGKFSPSHITIEEKWNYLHRANIWNPSPVETIRFYLEQGVEVNAQDIYGNTPLYYALRVQNGDAAMALLEAGADPNIANQEHLTPLQLSGYFIDRLEVVKKMLDCGADVHHFNGNQTVLESYCPREDEPELIPLYELMKQYA